MINPIKEARLKAGLQQYELAEKMGVTPVSVCNWEQGRSLPRAKRLRKLSKILGISVAKILEWENVG